jgi:hydrogenase maturation protease
MRTLIGAIGYRNLRDHSVAFEVLERLSHEDFGPDVVLEDVSYNPIALVQWLEEQSPHSRFERVILVAGVERTGRTPGTVTAYDWDGVLPSDDLIQHAITEAVTGIISLDNTLVIAGYFRALPAAVTIVEVEPAEHAFGFELSPPVERAVASVSTLIRETVA